MIRGLSTLLGLFFLTAGVIAVASLTKTPAPQPPPTPPDPDSRRRFLTLESPVFHARFSLN
jgi:hypothetical protein